MIFAENVCNLCRECILSLGEIGVFVLEGVKEVYERSEERRSNARRPKGKPTKSEEFISLRSDSSFCANRSSFHRSKWLKSG